MSGSRRAAGRLQGLAAPALAAPALAAADVAAGWLHRLGGPGRGEDTPLVLVTSLPKGGTNLLLKALGCLPGLRVSRLGIYGGNVAPTRPGAATVAVGVDWPTEADARRVRRRIGLVAPGSVLPAHLPHSRELADLLAALGVRVAAIVRDPRDVACSLPPYVLSRPHHFLHARFAALSPGQRLTAALEGLAADAGGRGLRSLEQRVRSVVSWADDPAAVLVRFEDLVGPQGGGSRQRQLDTLRTLADHLGVPCTPGQARHIAEHLFGGTDTFRKGQIGGWRQELTPEQLQIAARLDPLLVELGYEPTLPSASEA